MDTSAWLSFTMGVVGTVLTIGFFWFTVIGGLRKSISGNAGRIGILEERTKGCDKCQEDYRELSFKMDIWWDAIKPALLKVVHSPNHPRRDFFSEILLENRRPLTRPELWEYRELLNEAIKESTKPGELIAFSLVLAKVDEKLKVFELKGFENARVASVNH